MPGYIVRDNAVLRRARRTLSAFAIGAGVLVAGAVTIVAQEPPVRIAVVDIDYIAVQSPAGQVLAGEIAALQDQYNVELSRRQTEVEDIQARVVAADTTNVVLLRALQREYQDALTSFQRFQQDIQGQAQAFQAQGLQQVREEIGPALEAIMLEEGYDLILNNGNPGVVMNSDRVDITQLVLTRLQAGGDGG
ncbi:MAG: OmpH family outer membrane protein [Gemmatimonadota bacterium]|nr:OmpH family outer membrane protein [Gemmatimonadota bacterium]